MLCVFVKLSSSVETRFQNNCCQIRLHTQSLPSVATHRPVHPPLAEYGCLLRVPLRRNWLRVGQQKNNILSQTLIVAYDVYPVAWWRFPRPAGYSASPDQMRHTHL